MLGADAGNPIANKRVYVILDRVEEGRLGNMVRHGFPAP